MIRLSKNIALAASLGLLLAIPTAAKADFTLTLGNPTPSTFSGGGTTFNFAPPASPQLSSGTFAQPFNVINVGEPVASAGGFGSTTLTQTFTITGTGTQANLGTTTGTLTGLFTITGATSSFTNASIINLSTTGGPGFLVGNIMYAQPSVGSQVGSPTSGNISFVVTPVPEPTSVALLGLGSLGLGLLARRRMARA